MSVLANVDLDDRTFRSLVKENRAAIACYDGLNIAEASKLISSVERQIGDSAGAYRFLDFGNKLAAGVTHLLIDIPVGPKSRIKSTNEAMRLRKLIEYVGDMLSMEIDVVITDGSEPIGNGVGAVLEARDVMKVLRNKEDAPQDLLEKSLFLAGRLLEFDPKLRGGPRISRCQRDSDFRPRAGSDEPDYSCSRKSSAAAARTSDPGHHLQRKRRGGSN